MVVYPYIPNSVPELKAQMLKEIGIESVEEIYAEIPSHLRFKGRLNVPGPLPSECELRRYIEGILHKNNAARRKSRLMKKLNALQAPKPAAA